MFQFNLGVLYAVGLAVVAILLVYEHRLVKPDDLSKVGVAFFNMNGIISVVYFVFTSLDVFFNNAVL